AVVVVVDQARSRAVGLDDEPLFRRAHGVGPSSEAGLRSDVFEDHGPAFNEAASGDGTMLLIVGCRMRAAGVHASGRRRLSALLRAVVLRHGLGEQKSR